MHLRLLRPQEGEPPYRERRDERRGDERHHRYQGLDERAARLTGGESEGGEEAVRVY